MTLRLISSILIALAALAPRGHEFRPLTTAAEARGFAETISQDSAPFCLTGTVPHHICQMILIFNQGFVFILNGF